MRVVQDIREAKAVRKEGRLEDCGPGQREPVLAAGESTGGARTAEFDPNSSSRILNH